MLGSAHAAPNAIHAPTNLRGSSRTPPATLLLVSVDGLMPSQILGAEALNVQVPNLRQMIKDGAYASGVRTVVPSLTYPAHATILTGARPANHGIAANLEFDPTRRLGQWYWFSKDFQVSTLWDAARQAHIVTANVAWPVSVGASVDFNVPQFWGTTKESANIRRATYDRKLLRELSARVAPIPEGEDFSASADDVRASYVEYLIQHKHPAFITAYFGALDGVEHHTGPNSSFALRILERIDNQIGRLRRTLEAAAPDNAALVIVSDHGFVAYHTEVELGVLLRERQVFQLNSDGSVLDWQAAAWTAGGTAAIILKDPEDLTTQTAVAKLIKDMLADPKFGVDRVFTKPNVDELGGFAGADFVLALKPGFKFGTKLSGAALVDKFGGTHGYLPDTPGMDAALFMVGQSVPRGRCLGRVDMRDIAPTLAALISVKLPQAEGVNLLGPAQRRAEQARLSFLP